MGHKDISIVHAEAIGVQEAVCIFEGFMDFLSFKTLESKETEELLWMSHVIILS